MRRRETAKRADAARANRSDLDLIGWFELCHDKKRLKKIQDSLAPLGVEAEPFLGELSLIALKFSGVPYWKWFPTPHEAARDMRKTAAMIEDLVARLDAPCNHIDPATGWPMFPPLATQSAAQAALIALRADLQPRLDKLTAMGSGSRRNAVKVHIECLTALTRLWLAKVPNAASRPHRRKHLLRFLHACLEPLFPKDATTKKLTAFIDGYFRKTGA